MTTKKLIEDIDIEFANIQAEFSKDMDKAIDRIADNINSDTNAIVTMLFLFFWTKFHHIYGINGENYSTDFIKTNINRIIDGDIPPRNVMN
tara:strand:- start:264 stop:536 length:273 start_codon:yes stop_codon:yes gene_type:complete